MNYARGLASGGGLKIVNSLFQTVSL